MLIIAQIIFIFTWEIPNLNGKWFKSPKSEIARTVFQTYSKKYDEGKIQLRKDVTVHYHWTFHSNIGQNDERDCQNNFGVWKM